jgi:hypothetical protein
LTSFSYLFRNEWKWIIYFPTTYVYCIYRDMSKAPRKLSNCLKRAETSVVLIVFDCVLCEVCAYKLISINTVTVSFRRPTWIRYQKTIYWSVTKYSKKYAVNAVWRWKQLNGDKLPVFISTWNASKTKLEFPSKMYNQNIKQRAYAMSWTGFCNIFWSSKQLHTKGSLYHLSTSKSTLDMPFF